MTRFWTVLAVAVLLAASASGARLVEWDTDESAARFSRSAHKADFFALSNHFVSQDNTGAAPAWR